MKTEKKKNIILTASHLYLFWTTGVYYLWELSKKNNVILLVENYYKDNQQFRNVCKHLKVEKIVYYKMYRNPIASHYYYNKICKQMILEYSPKKIFHYNYQWIWNLYLSNWSRLLCRKCINTVYINGQLSRIDDNVIFYEDWEKIINEKSKKYFIPKWILRKSIHLLRNIKKFVEYSLLPFIVLGYIPQRMIKKSGFIPFNSILCYQDFEVEILKDILNKDENLLFHKMYVKKVKHPVKIYGNECNKFLYGSYVNDSVVLLPSILGFHSFSTELTALNKWMEVVNILKRKFPFHKIQLKLHPGVRNNPYLNEIKKYFNEKCVEVTMINPSVNSQQLICKSKVIVSDVSTVLWWANFLKEKTLISIDFHNFVGSDQMKYYDNIFYFESLDKLRGFNFKS